MTLKGKPQYKTLPVTKDDGTVVNVTRVALKDLETLLELQEKLLTKYVEADGSFGQLMSDSDLIADLTSICSLLPLVEKSKGETQYLNFEDIQDNWEQLITLFFNSGLDVETREAGNVLPSSVSQLHFFPYMQIIQRLVQEKAAREES
jgi:hypothetical protein